LNPFDWFKKATRYRVVVMTSSVFPNDQLKNVK